MSKARKKTVLAVSLSMREVGAASVTLIQSGDQTTEFRRDVDGASLVVQTRSQKEGALTRVVADPLDWYIHRGMITGEQWSAGDRLRRDHYIAFGSGYHAVNLDGFHGTSNYIDNWRISQRQGERLRDFIRTMNHFSMDERRMLEAVCVRGSYANEAARRCGMSPRKGIQMLRACLSGLAQYYHTARRSAPLPLSPADPVRDT
ncbi:hypothetical protein UFOVP32_57 [uncultured Caudovirales phage]|uniref:DUF6456 domain-containing protein n=1 Tax=uncultured Caudovirales phage TaxID=2100421 RepID=A0A6J5KP95_9CAUD|nr:hypothetical protein UFOVP32_57 [uncultured Caudovirales phage]CAB4123587.1 hypothetical protein UFOVP50_19 [uncultured Caudovirales phage]